MSRLASTEFMTKHIIIMTGPRIPASANPPRKDIHISIDGKDQVFQLGGIRTNRRDSRRRWWRGGVVFFF
jgi:hypothetical protein